MGRKGKASRLAVLKREPQLSEQPLAAFRRSLHSTQGGGRCSLRRQSENYFRALVASSTSASSSSPSASSSPSLGFGAFTGPAAAATSSGRKNCARNEDESPMVSRC